MPVTRENLTLLLILAAILIGLVSISPFSYYIFGKSDVHVDDINGVQGFTGTTITFQIYNSGNAASENTRVTVEMYPEEGQILESKTIYVGKLNPGQSKQMTTKMESSNVNNGTIRIIPSK
jgi:hypothetical protein